LVLAFSAVGGLIAYGADLLGRHLGKKRLSIFGLRPKHTAALLTTSAGVLLPLLTVGVLSLVSRDVRVILAEGSRAAAERDRKSAELVQVNQRLADGTRETQRVEGELTRRSGQLTLAEQRLANRNRELESRRQEIARLLNQTKALRQAVADVRVRVATAREQLGTLKGQYDTLQARFQRTTTSFTVLQRQVTDANEYSQRLGLESQRLERQIKDGENRFREVQAREQRAREELETTSKAFDELQQRFDEGRQQSARDLESARLELDRLKAESASLVAVTQSLSMSMDYARTRSMTYRLGDELARLTVPANSDATAASAAVSAVLRSARVEAQGRGAVAIEGQTAAGLRDVTIGGRPVSASEQEAQLVRQIQRSRVQLVLLANAIWNAYDGESVPLRVQARPNPLVFAKGTVLAEAKIDGSQPESAILEALSQLVTNQVRPRALREGLIPAAGRAEPLGQVSNTVVLQLVQEVRATGRTIRVVAVAAEDTRAADPLQLEFRIR